MGTIIPSIPYKSQYDADASEFRNDCGPASLAMILQSFGVHVSTDAVYRKTGTKANRYVSIGQLMRAGLNYGVTFEYFYDWSLDRLFEILAEGHPLIALVHYGAWSQLEPGTSTQNKFQGPHFVVVLGYDDQYIYVNDPLWKLDRRNEGYRKAWTHDQFMQAWNSNHVDGNRDRSGIYTHRVLATRPYSKSDSPSQNSVQFAALEAQRLQAWIEFFSLPEPDSENPASITAYLSAMSKWGHDYLEHKVSPEDDLTQISDRYYGDPDKWKVILAYNGLTETDTLFDETVLRIPEAVLSPPQASLPEETRGGTFDPVNLEKETHPSNLAEDLLRPVIVTGTKLGDNSFKQ